MTTAEAAAAAAAAFSSAVGGGGGAVGSVDGDDNDEEEEIGEDEEEEVEEEEEEEGDEEEGREDVEGGAGMDACVRHVPKPGCCTSTQSPRRTLVTAAPVATTSARPSLPPTATGAGVPSSVVKRGLLGYTPWIWFTSAGFMGAARKRTVMLLPYAGGME
jgi:hypothetical protein